MIVRIKKDGEGSGTELKLSTTQLLTGFARDVCEEHLGQLPTLPLITYQIIQGPQAAHALTWRASAIANSVIDKKKKVAHQSYEVEALLKESRLRSEATGECCPIGKSSRLSFLQKLATFKKLALLSNHNIDKVVGALLHFRSMDCPHMVKKKVHDVLTEDSGNGDLH